MKKAGAGGWFLHDIKNRGVTAWILFAILFFFYIALYFGQTHCQVPILVDEASLPAGETIPAWVPTQEQLQANYSQCVEGLEGFKVTEQWIYDNLTIHLDKLGRGFFPASWTEHGGDYQLQTWDHFGSRWSVYGILYTLAILLGGIWMLIKYRHNMYQVVRTSVVMFVQVSFAFSIPILLKALHQPEYYFSYLWPLKHEYLDPSTLNYYGSAYPTWGEVVVLYGFLGSIILVPLMAIFFGKRWYCSWVCGCGGLANTAGEPFRHLSDKSRLSWQIEKVSIHSVMVLSIGFTALYFASFFLHGGDPSVYVEAGEDVPWLMSATGDMRRFYSIFIVASLSGLVGVAFYPIGGTRVWCRFACPMAAVLGLIQKIGRYRIRVKKDMCISCGMCSKYCEMGIDVRAYAQANKSFTRASCVGCGLCAEVCPRGVLRLENVRKRDPQELSWKSLMDESWKAGESKIGARD